MNAANLFYSDVGIYKLVSVHVITNLDEIKLTVLGGLFNENLARVHALY